ncbi:MAG: response regulator [Myxococcales bacterium]|nr:response regulator [Myxococcales bacterium]
MADRTLLCVEPDEATLATIREALASHGFQITNITNGEEAVAWGRQHQPSLVIVSVEPRKVGYAICNKFKRSPELKDIPLILISGEETPQQLEQHRKLKVKANEYLVKPFSPQELVDKVSEVFALDEAGGFGKSDVVAMGEGDDDDLLLSSDVLEEIPIGDGDIVEDDPEGNTAEVVMEAEDYEGGDFSPGATRALDAGALDVFDAETDAAFAAIQREASAAAPGPAPWGSGGASSWNAQPEPEDDLREDEVEDALAKLSESATRAGGALDGGNLFAATQMPTRALGPDEVDVGAEAEFSGFEGSSVDAASRVPTSRPATPLPPSLPRPPSPFDDDDDEPTGGPILAMEAAPGEASPAYPAFELPGFALSDSQGADPGPAAADESGGELAPIFPDAPLGYVPQTSELASSDEAARLRDELAALEPLRQQWEPLRNQLAAAESELEALREERAAHEAVKAELHELRLDRDRVIAERDQLSREVDDIKSRPQAPGSARDREILSLREVINKKERDLLDLRDQLDGKERQILDHKDRIRENERARRDMEDKNLALERALMEANERVEAVTSDKQKGVEREKALKARLDDAHVEIQKAHDEVETLKKRGAATEERLRTEMDRLRGELEGRILEMEDTHRNELAQAAEERAHAEGALEQEHHDALSRMRVAHAAELESTQRKAADDLAALDDRLQGELVRLRKDHDKSVASLKEEHTLQLAAEREAHQTALDAKERDHRNEILGMRRRQEDELRAAEERRQRELADADMRFKVELDAAENRRRGDLQIRDEQHNSQVAEMDRRHFEQKTQAAERHRAEMDDALARVARAEGDLAARTEELSEAHRRMGGLEADLDAARADLRDREVKLSQANLKLLEVENKNTQYEEQIMRSYQRMRSDDKTIDKAKRALAVALSLLEERGLAQGAVSSVVSPVQEHSTATGLEAVGQEPVEPEDVETPIIIDATGEGGAS